MDDLLQRLSSIERMDINQWHSAQVRNTVIDARKEIERLRAEIEQMKDDAFNEGVEHDLNT